MNYVHTLRAHVTQPFDAPVRWQLNGFRIIGSKIIKVEAVQGCIDLQNRRSSWNILTRKYEVFLHSRRVRHRTCPISCIENGLEPTLSFARLYHATRDYLKFLIMYFNDSFCHYLRLCYQHRVPPSRSPWRLLFLFFCSYVVSLFAEIAAYARSEASIVQ